MLDESGTPTTLRGEVAFCIITILKKTNIRVNNTQASHDLWYGKTPMVKYFKVFGSKYYIKRTDENVGKFEPRADEGILLGYSSRSKGYKCYNKRLGNFFESIDVVVDEASNNSKQIREEENTPSRYVQKNHPETQILGQKEVGVQTRRTITEASSYLAFLSSAEPQNVSEACKNECWVKALNEELEQIEKNNTWELVPIPNDKNVTGTKWIFKNKLNGNGDVIKNKARIVCKGYAQ
eukprot:PITA_14189